MQMQHGTRESTFKDSEDVQWIKRLRRRSVCSSKWRYRARLCSNRGCPQGCDIGTLRALRLARRSVLAASAIAIASASALNL